MRRLILFSLMLFFVLILSASPLWSDNLAETKNEIKPAPDAVVSFPLRSFFVREAREKKKPEDKHWYFLFGGGVDFKSGNTNSVIFNVAGSIRYDNNLTECIFSAGENYGENGEEQTENKGNVLLNLDRYIGSPFKVFVFTGVDYNRMTSLAARSNSGAGLKYVFTRNKYLISDFSAAPLFEYKKLDKVSGEKIWRISLRARAKLVPLKDFEIEYVYFYIPKIGNLDDYRFTHDLRGNIKLGTNLVFTSGFMYSFDNGVPATKKKSDQYTFTKVSINL